MYLPRHFEEDRIEILAEFLRDHPFATLVSLAGDGLIATHLPLLWDAEPTPFGTLTGHFARPNPHGREARAEVESLAIFHGPHAYVSPSWYASKREHGKVVPTWNYTAVHAYGSLRTIDDPQWLRAFVTRLTDLQEGRFSDPWLVTDAPEAFVSQHGERHRWDRDADPAPGGEVEAQPEPLRDGSRRRDLGPAGPRRHRLPGRGEGDGRPPSRQVALVFPAQARI